MLTPSVISIKCHYAECRYTECRIFLLLCWVSYFLIVMLNDVILSVVFSCCYAEFCIFSLLCSIFLLSFWMSYFLIVMLNYIMLSVVLLNVVAPSYSLSPGWRSWEEHLLLLESGLSSRIYAMANISLSCK
jgi:hypothetical protein